VRSTTPDLEGSGKPPDVQDPVMPITFWRVWDQIMCGIRA